MKSSFAEVAGRTFDLLIVGGGIFGAGAAREAALNGWSVCLCEQADLASETSSRSSKLIHGGLRYLEHLEIGLVRQALRERHVLATLAPHLIRPLPFLAPVLEDARVGPLKLKTGLFLYDLLARAHTELRRGWLDRAEVAAAEPAIDAAGLRGAGTYFDFQTTDARLVATVARAAALRGAAILTRARVLDLSGGPPDVFLARVQDVRGGEEFSISARAVIAATGPFSDMFRARLGGSQRLTRLTSGAHIVLPAALNTHALILTARSDGRVFFAIPFEGRTLVGTTDRDFEGDPTNPIAEERDIEWLLAEVNHAFGETRFRRDDVISTFCGVRTLARDDAANPSATSREQSFVEEPPGCIHIIGGKLTTWRLIAREALERVARSVGLSLDDGTASESTALPGGDALAPDESGRLARAFRLDANVASRLVARYGSEAEAVLRFAEETATPLEPVGRTIPELEAELAWLARNELAETAEDALRRRLPRLLTDRIDPADLARADEIVRRHRGS